MPWSSSERISDLASWARNRTAASAVDTAGSVEMSVRDPQDLGAAQAAVTTASPATRRPSRLAFIGRGERQTRRHQRERAADCSGDSLIVSSGCSSLRSAEAIDRRRRAERLGEAGLERSELEEVEQPLDARPGSGG